VQSLLRILIYSFKYPQEIDGFSHSEVGSNNDPAE